MISGIELRLDIRPCNEHTHIGGGYYIYEEKLKQTAKPPTGRSKKQHDLIQSLNTKRRWQR